MFKFIMPGFHHDKSTAAQWRSVKVFKAQAGKEDVNRMEFWRRGRKRQPQNGFKLKENSWCTAAPRQYALESFNSHSTNQAIPVQVNKTSSNKKI